LSLTTQTDTVSEALMAVKSGQEINVKWDQKKDPKPS